MPQLLGHVANKCLGPARLDTGLGLSPDALPKAMGSSLLTAPTVFSTVEMTTILCGQTYVAVSTAKRHSRVRALPSGSLLYEYLGRPAKARVFAFSPCLP